MTEWKEVEGFPYLVSNNGEVMHRDHKKILQPKYRSKGGYPSVELWFEGKHHSRRIHVLVALAFIGPRPGSQVIHHKDHNVRNNHVSNLEYISNNSNVRLSGKAGRSIQITDIIKQQIKLDRSKGLLQQQLADKYKLHQGTISRILNNKD